jgi:NADH-quinone oxidoreductase subunit C
MSAKADWFKGLAVVESQEEDYARTGLYQTVVLQPGSLVAAATRLYRDGYFLEDVTGLDTTEGIEVLYHFDTFEGSSRLRLKVVTPHDDPRVPSITGIYDGAQWHERETTDFYGVAFEGIPNPAPLLLPDDMEERPLLKTEKKRLSRADLMPGEESEEEEGDEE